MLRNSHRTVVNFLLQSLLCTAARMAFVWVGTGLHSRDGPLLDLPEVVDPEPALHLPELWWSKRLHQHMVEPPLAEDTTS